MIIRIWHGLTRSEDGDDYFDYIMKTGVPFYRSQKGCQGVLVSRRIKEGYAEFLLLSLWDSMESIRRFTGPEVDKAVYHFPGDRTWLVEMETFVRHFEILAAAIDPHLAENPIGLMRETPGQDGAVRRPFKAGLGI